MAGCGETTDGLGDCVEATADWWPLPDGAFWQYQQLDFTEGPVAKETLKDLRVEHEVAEVQGVFGRELGARTWRWDRDLPAPGAEAEDGTGHIEAGWRWFPVQDQAFGFRRDLWVEEGGELPPCPDQGWRADPADCLEATPIKEVRYDPPKIRLSYRADRVCERSAWTAHHTETTILIGRPDPEDESNGACALDEWRADPESCLREDGIPHGVTVEEVDEEWSVQYLDRTIEVPAGRFEHCLCVRRRDPKHDKTYCFARDVGKVFELDRGYGAECLARYEVGQASGPPDDWDFEPFCDSSQVEE